MFSKIKAFCCFLTCIIILLLPGCTCNSYYNNRPEDVADAEKVTSNFYALLTLDQPKQMYALLSDRFIQAADVDTVKFVRLLKQFDDKLGKVEKYSLKNWQTSVVKGTNARAEYMLVYDVKRDKNNTVETFNLEGENGKIRITGYHVALIASLNDSEVN